MDEDQIGAMGSGETVDGKTMHWFVMRVSGQGLQYVLAESPDIAAAIVGLAFPGSTVLGKWGFAKTLPTHGTPVLRQVAVPAITPTEVLSPKDDRELRRRNGVNYERSGF